MSDTTHADLEDVIRRAIEQVAPDVDAGQIAGDQDYRAEVGLDSMDFITFIETIERETGVTIPELDYADITTIEALAAYLADVQVDSDTT